MEEHLTRILSIIFANYFMKLTKREISNFFYAIMKLRDLILREEQTVRFGSPWSRDVYTLKKEATNEKTRIEHADVARRIFRLIPVCTGKKEKREKKSGVARGAFGLLVISRQVDCTCSSG